jgi:predicted acyl esterase
MHRLGKLARLGIFCAIFIAGIAPLAVAQGRTPDPAAVAKRSATEKELESIAIIEHKVMVPMRDGKRMQADIYNESTGVVAQ